MKLSSPNFENNSNIPIKYTCQGENISPELNISDVPADAKSLFLIMDDPDSSNNWVHWLIWNIPPSTKTIPENVDQDFAIQGTNSFGTPNYGGPCPPSGTHHYVFKLYALKKNLELTSSTKKDEAMAAIKGLIISQTKLTGIYQKQ